MNKLILTDVIKNLFTKNRQCIINADIDGIMAGMLLQKFLNWNVVGYSSCRGKYDDELWIKEDVNNIGNCVFVDLPVAVSNLSVIDQHFVAFNKESISRYNNDANKANPNIMRNKVYCDDSHQNQYTQKYPFGTTHFVLAILENLGYIKDDYVFNFSKKIEEFDLAGLVLRADRVISNTYLYTRNCLDWADWIISLGGRNTKALFFVVKNEYKKRRSMEKLVENKIIFLGCKSRDGDCSNLLRTKNYQKLNLYFDFLSSALEIEKLPVNNYIEFNRLTGKRMSVTNINLEIIEKECVDEDIFSYAFVSMRELSLTYYKEESSKDG